MADPQLRPVDHDPFADDMAPVEHNPFDGEVLPPEDVGKMLQSITKMEERMLSVEMAIAQAVYEIRGALGSMGANVNALHTSHEKLRQTIAAPKRIVRDETGRPTGVVVDQSL